MPLKKIVMLMPYFGTWPDWIDIYLETCRYNPTIDWIFFTDCGLPENRPDNVRFIDIPLADFYELAEGKLEIDLPRHNGGMKICDFRPMFGVIFEDYIGPYDFYGHGDIDVVYGNIRKLVSPRALEESNVLSFHSGMIAGHFSLYRNSEYVRDLYWLIDDWPALLQHPANLRVDEDIFTPVVHCAGNTCFWEAYSTPCIWRKWKDGTWNFPTEWYWRDGNVTNNKDQDEYLYFHFLFWKGGHNPRGWQYRRDGGEIVHGDWKDAPHGWRIDEDGFHPLEEQQPRKSYLRRKVSEMRSRITLERARFIDWKWKMRWWLPSVWRAH
jgi:hypothetical protein